MTASVDSAIARLNKIGLQEIAGIWRNVIHRLHLAGDDGDLLRLLSEIHLEWERRRLAPRPGDLARAWKVERESDRPGSPLSAHGYNVRFKQSLWNGERQDILRRCFEEPLMPAFVQAEMLTWRAPGSITRLRKILDFLDHQIRSDFTQQNKQNAVALRREDLKFLRARYADEFDVAWPRMDAEEVRFVKE